MNVAHIFEKILPGSFADLSKAGQQDRPLRPRRSQEPVHELQLQGRFQTPYFSHEEDRVFLISVQKGCEFFFVEAIGGVLQIVSGDQTNAPCFHSGRIHGHGKIAQRDGQQPRFLFGGVDQPNVVENPGRVLPRRIGRDAGNESLHLAPPVGRPLHAPAPLHESNAAPQGRTRGALVC